MSTENCVVLLTDNAYFNKMIYTLTGIVNNGYIDDICIVIGDDLVNSSKLNHQLLAAKNITIKYFPNIQFSDKFLVKFNNLNRDSMWIRKKFQYHKLHLFNTFFKQWKYIFYIDSGCTVYGSIYHILNVKKKNKFLAHSDSYPTYASTLECQFDKTQDDFSKIGQKYNFNVDYPQTTIMLYDTDIISNNTYNELIALSEECNMCITNDQGIIGLYFICVKAQWEPIQLENEQYWLYDYLLRSSKLNKPHIILKAI